MFDYITACCLFGLVIFGYLWGKASPKVWYMDSDNDPVSLKTIIGLIWLVCLVTLVYQQYVYIIK